MHFAAITFSRFVFATKFRNPEADHVSPILLHCGCQVQAIHSKLGYFDTGLFGVLRIALLLSRNIISCPLQHLRTNFVKSLPSCTCLTHNFNQGAAFPSSPTKVKRSMNSWALNIPQQPYVVQKSRWQLQLTKWSITLTTPTMPSPSMRWTQQHAPENALKRAGGVESNRTVMTSNSNTHENVRPSRMTLLYNSWTEQCLGLNRPCLPADM